MYGHYIDAHVHPLVDIEDIIAQADRAGVKKLFLLATEFSPRRLESPEVRRFLRKISEESLFMIDLELYRRFGTPDPLDALNMFYEDLVKSYPRARVMSEDVVEFSRRYPERIVPDRKSVV